MIPDGELRVHQSLVRPVLFAGTEAPLLFAGILSVLSLTVGTRFDGLGILLAVAVTLVLRPLALRMATADPILTRVLLRALPYEQRSRLRSYYPPVGHPEASRRHPSW